jgi:MFS family permease
VSVEPHYLTHWLPGALLVGVGVALSFPVLSAAAVAGLPQERFGVGGAMNQTARQVGAVLGVAILIAIIGTPTSLDDALAHFRAAWLVGALAVLGSAAISSFHRRPALVAAPVVVLAPRTSVAQSFRVTSTTSEVDGVT